MIFLILLTNNTSSNSLLVIITFYYSMAIERQHRPIDKEFEEADYTGILDISNRKLRIFPNIGDDIYDVLEVFDASKYYLFNYYF